ncbi:Rha family transcriptional regulator, partial [Pseudomonas aeruginosa]|uniref:Rha family transcriptional regulator n=2 Tax=Pseudomonas TaxID=286 RepID=UPI001F3C42CC
MINLTTIGGQPVTMSSREITELTGKQHKHVIRDIREMLDALEKDGPVLGHVREDKDSRGYTENFHLDRELTETLVTGYSIPLRHKV